MSKHGGSFKGETQRTDLFSRISYEEKATNGFSSFRYFQPLNPFLKMSPRHNGSTLYDSFELEAVTRQLNKAMQMSVASSPTYIRYLKSPFYSQRLDHIRKENVNATKKVLDPQVTSTTENKKARTKETVMVTAGIVARLWKKVKHGVLKNRKKV